MIIRINKAAFILILVFLSGCGKEESTPENRVDTSAKVESNEDVSAKTESNEDISEETGMQYPLIATPADAKKIELAIVSEDNYCIFDGEKYGFITENGEEIAPCIYDIAYPFNEGLACVCKDGKYGYIDLEGETAIPFDYDRATPFVEGLAYFSIGDTYGFMDQTGTPVFQFECDSISSFQEGLAYFSKDGQYGYVDQNGQMVIKPVFDDAGYFQEGLAKVRKDGRCGVINRDGDFIIAAEYDSINIEDWFIITQSDGKYTCFDRTGKSLLEQSDGIGYITTRENYACFWKDEKQGLIDEQGNVLIEPMYDWILSLIPEQNLLIVQEDGLYGIVDLQGEIMIPAVYDYIRYDSYEDGTEGGMLVLTDADGKIESMDAADLSERIPCNYDSIVWLNEDKAVVSLNGLSGIIDREGRLIEPVGYDIIKIFDSGAVWMQKDSKTWFYNSSGEIVEDIGDYDDIFQYGNCYQTKLNGKYGFLNEKGEKVIPTVYDSVKGYNAYGSANVCILTDYSSDIRDSVIKTGETQQTDISNALLQNEITPRIGLYQRFTQNGCISVDDFTVNGFTASQEYLKEYRKTYKLYDLNHTGKPILYFQAEPYINHNFPMSYSGFYAIRDNQLVELITGYECGGSMRGDYVCLWYDRETARIFLGTNGFYGGFGGYASSGDVYDGKEGEMTSIASFEWMTQPLAYFSDEELGHAELVYDNEGKPYTKEIIEQAEKEIAQIYWVNRVQTTVEEYQEMTDRYQMIPCLR